jgi:hypothetical protein
VPVFGTLAILFAEGKPMAYEALTIRVRPEIWHSLEEVPLQNCVAGNGCKHSHD